MKNLDTHSGHTVGPWIIRDRTGTVGNPSLGIEGPGREVIASVIYQNGFDALQSNARLIAAAPELLEACKTILLNLDPSGDHPKSQHVLYSDCLGPENDDQTIVEYLKGVISKAEGNL